MRRWLWLLLALWLLACAWLIAGWSDAIATLALPDSDDNLRLLQVRDWLGGQGWFDLRQHRLAPAGGADIHWSRLADLPLAAVMLLLKPLLGSSGAELAAVVFVPLLTLFVAMLLVALIARRLVAPQAWAFAAAILLMATPAVGMMSPLRIDHHGWQIVLLLAMLLGLIDRRRAAGGILAGLAIAGSLAIGVEMLPYLGLGIALAVLGWMADPQEAARMRSFAAALGLGTFGALLIFVPPGARGSGCDALSMAYAGPLLLGSALLFAATWLPLSSPVQRLLAVAPAGAAVAALLFTTSAVCIVDPYHAVDPEARRLWLDRVSEALPLYRQGTNAALAILALPLIGLSGAIMMIRRTHGEALALRGWLLIAVVAAFSLLLATIQTRAAVTAQAVAAPGAAALLYFGCRRIQRHGAMLVRVFGSVLLFLGISGLLPRLAINAAAAEKKASPAEARLAKINERCLDPRSMAALNQVRPATLLADVDLTTPLLTHTHHRALAGPYHRNGRVIVDVMEAWAGSSADGLAVVRRYGLDYVATCGMNAEAESQVERAPHGLYASLLRNQPPAWLHPVALAGTPWRLWRVQKSTHP